MKSASERLPGQVKRSCETHPNYNLPTKSELLLSELVKLDIYHQNMTANTIKVADYFGKRPSEINRRINSLNKRGLCKIAPSYYLNDQGKKQVYYELNRQQFAQVVLAFTGHKAEEFRKDYTTAFEEKDAELNEWRKGRLAAANSTIAANDAVYELQKKLKDEYPKSRKSSLIFIHLQQAINRAVIGVGSVNRNTLSTCQLTQIEGLEQYVNSYIVNHLEDDPADVRQTLLNSLKLVQSGDINVIQKKY